MSHVAHVNEAWSVKHINASCHTRQRGMSHTWMRHVTHIWMRHVTHTKEARHTHGSGTWHTSLRRFAIRRMCAMTQVCAITAMTYACVMTMCRDSCVLTSMLSPYVCHLPAHVTCVISINEWFSAYQWIISSISMSHLKHMNASSYERHSSHIYECLMSHRIHIQSMAAQNQYTHVWNESCVIYKWLITHMRMSIHDSLHTCEWVYTTLHTHVCYEKLHMTHYMCAITRVWFHTWHHTLTHAKCIPSSNTRSSSISHVTHLSESCHTFEWVMSHIWMRHVTCMNDSCHIYE